MFYQLLIEPEADQDISQAFSWYEEQRTGLGREFLESLDEVLRRIGSSPTAHAAVHKNVRQTLLRRFPYVVCYLIEDSTVAVIAVYHASRDPMRWKERLD